MKRSLVAFRSQFYQKLPCLILTQRAVRLPTERHRTPSIFSTIAKTTRSRKRRWFSTTPPTPTTATFADLDLHPALQRALHDGGWHTLTAVQERTYAVVTAGQYDVLARARTGTGKTLAFLVPSLQRLLSSSSSSYDANDRIRMIVLSPTRELAHQIALETRRLTKYCRGGPLHDSNNDDDDGGDNNPQHNAHPILTSQVMYGGVPKTVDVRRMQQQGGVPTVLIATPGRLVDHLRNTHVTINNGNDETDVVSFRSVLSQVQILVLDEMDSLLDMGFRAAIQEILQHLPPHRQTLLFSATAATDFVEQCVNPINMITIDCISNDGDSNVTPTTAASSAAAVTHAHIPQSYVVIPTEQVVWRTLQIVLKGLHRGHKLLVFFPTTAQVVLMAQLLQHGLGKGSVWAMHAQLSPGRRAVVSDRFRHARRKAVLLTTDVSARGMDYPHVTHVVQVGVAPNRETYVHRVGRTGRAGRPGRGLVVLTPPEVAFVQQDLSEIPITVDADWQDVLHRPLDRQLEDDCRQLTTRVRDGQWPELEQSAQEVYESLLGYYTSRIRRWSAKGDQQWQDDVIALATDYCRQTGLNQAPHVTRRLAEQLGLANHPGLVVRDRWASGRTFDVGSIGQSENTESIWTKRPKDLQRERLTSTAGLWEEEFDS